MLKRWKRNVKPRTSWMQMKREYRSVYLGQLRAFLFECSKWLVYIFVAHLFLRVGLSAWREDSWTTNFSNIISGWSFFFPPRKPHGGADLVPGRFFAAGIRISFLEPRRRVTPCQLSSSTYLNRLPMTTGHKGGNSLWANHNREHSPVGSDETLWTLGMGLLIFRYSY